MARHVVPGSGAEQRQRGERADDQAGRLGAEHHTDQLAAVLPVGVLTHQHGADQVVPNGAESEKEPEPDQHPERRRQRRPDGGRHRDRRD